MYLLAVPKSPTSVQLDPFQVSVSFSLFDVLAPPIAKASLLHSPAEPVSVLPKFKSLTSVQLVPFQVSVTAVLGGDCPPKTMASELLLPVPPALYLDVFKSPTSVQDEPLQDSVIARRERPQAPPAKPDE